MDQVIDFSTLTWVKKELDSTLGDARHSLEAHVENSGERDNLQRLIEQLRQVHGTLQMVELYGASILVEEMERVAIGVEGDSISQHDEACGLLMRSIIQLPDYLDRLVAGHRDIPLVLLPLLNDLRAIRGEALLSESIMFAPNLDASLPVGIAASSVADDALHVTAKEVRHSYQLGLLAWLRSDKPENVIEPLLEVVDKLLLGTAEQRLVSMWWIAAGLLDALRDGSVKTSASVKRIMGQIDREIKRFSDGDTTVTSDSDELMRNMLFYVGQAHPEGEGRITQIQSTYQLKDLLPDESEVAAAGRSLSGENAELMETVAVAIREELVRLKDMLEGSLTSQSDDDNHLGELKDGLQSLGDTLGMISLGAARNAVIEKTDALQFSIDEDSNFTEQELLDIANVLLFVESSVNQMNEHSSTDDNVVDVNQRLAEAEMNKVTDALHEEAMTNFSRAKEAIVTFMDADSDVSELTSVPGWFAEISGGLSLIGETRAVAVLRAVEGVVEDELINGSVEYSESRMKLLARSICGVEYYLEGTRENRVHADSALEVAEGYIQELGYELTPITPAIVEEPQASEEELPNEVDLLSLSESIEVEENISDLVEESENEDLSSPQSEPVIAEETGDELAVMGDDTDEEIVEIFLEEVDEEIESIQKSLPAWIRNPDDKESMATLRRSFHTLKGSGRLVGAMRMGEFAWAMENLLNRVIENTVPLNAFVTDLFTEASVLLVELATQIKDGTPTQGPVGQLMERADALSAGETSLVVEPAVSEVISEVASDDMANEISEEDISDDNEMDPVLYEIYSDETRSHIAAVREFLGEKYENQLAVSEELTRALHTIRGSSHMVNETELANLSGLMDMYAIALNAEEQLIDVQGWQAFSDGIEIVEQMLNALPYAYNKIDGLNEFVERIESLTGAVAIQAEQNKQEALPEMDLLVSEVDSTEPASDLLSANDEQNDNQNGVVNAQDSEPAETSEDLDIYADLDLEILEIFLEESEENMQSAYVALGQWRESFEDNAALGDLQRAAHTVKGGARMVELGSIGDLAHAIESLTESLEEGLCARSEDSVDGLQQALDVLGTMVAAVQSRSSLDDPEKMIEALAALQIVPVAEVVAEHVTEPVAQSPAESLESKVETVSEEPVVCEEIVDDSVEVQELEIEEPVAPYSDIDPELLEVFLEEANDILESTEHMIQAWKSAPEDKTIIAEFQRELHTLKGGARMADISAIGDLAHDIETLTELVSDNQIQSGNEMFFVLEQSHDRLASMIADVQNGEIVQEASDLRALLSGLSTGKAIDVETIAIVPDTSNAKSEETLDDKTSGEDSERRAASRSGQELVRIRTDLLDDLVNYAGEVSIYRSRLEQQVGAYRFNLVELEQTVLRVREQLRKMEMETDAQILFRYEQEADEMDESFDPLEMDRYSNMQQLSRSLGESVSDLGSIQGMLDNITRESETLLLQQSRVNTELQEGLMRTRMVPFLSLSARMRRIVRQTSQELGKKAELELSGAEGEMDRSVVDRIIAPIEHMLRNSLSHGIETPEQRRALGKPETGTISLTLVREASDVVLRISDDGAGINLDAIRQKAIESGLMEAENELTDNEVLQYILESGFSTAKSITQVSGRGVGLDVVNSEVKQLGGSLHIDSEAGKGSTFTVRLPFTLAVNQALLVSVGEDLYAIPLSTIEGVVRMKAKDVQDFYDNPLSRFDYGGHQYEVRHLGGMLGTSNHYLEEDSKVPVLLARTGEHCVAFQVEELFGSREIVVKTVGAQISSVRGVSGATILGDGRVVMILDVAGLIRSGGLSASVPLDEMIHPTDKANDEITVMVVDDSITVRKVTTRLLERNDMNVISAKDGVDAVAVLHDHIPDVMLLDIEMPRMDGFELATYIRNDSRLRDIPIIMITSRTGDKHRNRAMEIGVNRYLGKPFQEGELMENINALLELEEA